MTTVITILLLVVLVGLWCWIMSGIGHQFPTAYTLLKSSPGIDRRETWAVRFILALMVVFLLLAVTTLF